MRRDNLSGKSLTTHSTAISVIFAVIVLFADDMVYSIYYFPDHFSYDYSGKYFGMQERLHVFISY